MTRSASISVVIPAFQAERTLAHAVRSVLAQEPRPLEVIVVDDGSTDRTAEIAHGISGVRVVQQTNGGEASARNAGLRSASTEWVAFLDADDRFLPGRMAAIETALRSDPGVDVITANGFLEVDGQLVGTCYGPQWRFERLDQRREILRRNFVFGHVVVKRNRLLALGGFDETISHTTDWQMWIRLILDGGRVGYVDDHLSVYQLHGQSLSANPLAMACGGLASLGSAADHPSLSTDEHRVLIQSLEDQRRLVARTAMSVSLLGNTVDRASASLVLRDRGQPLRVRGRAAAAALAPRLSSVIQRRRRRGYAVGATGRLVPDSGAPVPDQSDADVPLVSVILPFLNEGRFLEGAIQTVQAQTTQAWELLLVDDGSSDASIGIAENCAREHPGRVRVLRHPGGTNQGLAASRNLGLEHARGGAIAFLDADDRWCPDKLARQLLVLATQPTAAMVCGTTKHRMIGGDRPDVDHPVVADAPRTFGRGAFARRIAREAVLMPPPPSSVLLRADALRTIGGVPAGDSLYEDQRTFVAVNLRYEVFVSDQDSGCVYTRRPDSLFGSLEHDPATKSRQRRTFEWWMLDRCMRSGPVGWHAAAALVSHRFRVAIIRRVQFRRQKA